MRTGLSKSGVVGLVALSGLVVACLGSVWWTFGAAGPGEPARYAMGSLDRVLEAPSLSAGLAGLLGRDHLGRSLLIRCLAGGAVSIGVGLAAAAIAVGIGTAYGSIAGWVGGRVDSVMMRVVDILYGLPYILLVVLLAVAGDALLAGVAVDWSPQTRRLVEVGILLTAIGGVSWLTMARVIRGQVLSLKSMPFVESARAAGVGPARVFVRHLLPNLLGPILVYATLTVPQAILQESFLSFLGIGVRAPMPSWGNLASDGLGELNPVKSRWWLLVFPCALLATTLLSLNFVGEGLREAFDPRRSSK